MSAVGEVGRSNRKALLLLLHRLLRVVFVGSFGRHVLSVGVVVSASGCGCSSNGAQCKVNLRQASRKVGNIEPVTAAGAPRRPRPPASLASQRHCTGCPIIRIARLDANALLSCDHHGTQAWARIGWDRVRYLYQLRVPLVTPLSRSSARHPSQTLPKSSPHLSREYHRTFRLKTGKVDGAMNAPT